MVRICDSRLARISCSSRDTGHNSYVRLVVRRFVCRGDGNATDRKQLDFFVFPYHIELAFFSMKGLALITVKPKERCKI